MEWQGHPIGVLANGLLPPAQKPLRSSEQRLDSKTPTFQEGGYNNRHGGQMEKSQNPQNQACTTGINVPPECPSSRVMSSSKTWVIFC